MMEIIRFPPQSGIGIETNNAKIVNGWDSVTWIERYREPGEFTITASLHGDYVKQLLPPGTLISHIRTQEVMIVESQEITESDDDELPTVTITGRSFETFLENRIVGQNRNWRIQTWPIEDFKMVAESSWNQAAVLINQHIWAGDQYDGSDGNTNLAVGMKYELQNRTPRAMEERSIKIQDVHKALLELLAIDNCGIRAARNMVNPYPGSTPVEPFLVSNDFIRFWIYQGVDRSKQVVFSHQFGELEKADYLWSNKNEANAAYVTGTLIHTVVNDDYITGIDRKYIHVEAKDVDEWLTESMMWNTLLIQQIQLMLARRGRAALAARNSVEIVNPQISPEIDRWAFRWDYDLGDLVGVEGKYNSKTVMRVLEHVEIADENGYSSNPVLGEL